MQLLYSHRLRRKTATRRASAKGHLAVRRPEYLTSSKACVLSRGTAPFLILMLLGVQVVRAEQREDDGRGFATSLQGKLIVGYQGWFVCPDATRQSSGWVHWMKDGKATVDMLPDTTDLSESEFCPTPWTSHTGKTIDVYSAQIPETVERHFAWMQEYGIDGVALQRFATELGDPARGPQIDRVLSNVQSSAERHNRSFFVEYDPTGTHDRDGISRVIADWVALEAHGTGKSVSYQQHRGHPVIGLFGLGFGGDRLHHSGSGARAYRRSEEGQRELWRSSYLRRRPR